MVDFPSTNSESPHEVNVIESQPAAILCGTVRSIPESIVYWSEIVSTIPYPIRLSSQRAFFTNYSLLLLEPRVSDTGMIIRCAPENPIIGTPGFGYFRVNVQGL